MAFDRAFAGATIYCEASGQSALARRMVAWSLFNRLRDGRFGSTIAQICLRRAQFSEWLSDPQDNANLLRMAGTPETDSVLMDALSAYQEALAGNGPDPTGGATHFYAEPLPAPSWTEPPAIFTVQEGRLRFYRNVP